ncbi:unnamed protein product [Rotaria sp. Silwood1]|nr:unnamed protein product [Rotaria sp. Silwood1]
MNNKAKDKDDEKVMRFNRTRTIDLEAEIIHDDDTNEILEVIDLCSPTVGSDDLSMLPVLSRNTCISNTLTERFPNLSRRLSIVACYPSNNHNQNQQDNGEPLLPNIPSHQLTRTELSRRSLGSIKSALQIVQNNTTIPSFLREKYHLYYDDLLERLKGDFGILDFNYTRFNKYMRMLAYEQMRVFNLRPHEILRIDEKEYPIGLDFYLQFDDSSGLHFRFPVEHREHDNRIIYEFLIGQENILRDLPRGKSKEVLAKDRMKLYQHSTQCPVAMQIFLDANPQYWRFVPMPLEEAERPEQKKIEPVIFSEVFWNIRSKEDTLICVQAVPKPSHRFTFSNRQIMLQTQFFHKTRDTTLPNPDIDLYNAIIVAILPETCTDMLCFTIESLFISYGETKLNSIGNVLNVDQNSNYYPLNAPWLLRSNEWCQGLVRRPQPTSTNSVKVVATK